MGGNATKTTVVWGVMALAALLFVEPVFAGDPLKKEKAMHKVLIVLTSHDRLGDTGKKTGAYLPEITHPYEVFTKAGVAVEFVSPKGGRVPLDGVDLDDPINKTFLDDPKRMGLLENTAKASGVDPKGYAAVFYAGGHGTMWDFPDDPSLAAIAAAVYDRGGVVGAVCHGPAGLVNVKLAGGQYLVAGKRVAAFTNEEEAAVEKSKIVPFLLETKLTERGAEVKTAAKFTRNVVTSERLVTGQNPASAAGVAEEMVKLLQTR
jgi:putative intracellular protease/amidase